MEWEVAQRYPTAVIRRADARTIAESTRSTLSATHAATESADYERVAELPPGTRFTPGSLYRIRGTLPGTRENIFEMEFETDSNGLPAIQ